jgi:hypothetical protein
VTDGGKAADVAGASGESDEPEEGVGWVSAAKEAPTVRRSAAVRVANAVKACEKGYRNMITENLTQISKDARLRWMSYQGIAR